ncbi:MAG: hypothetical protein ABWY82_16060 [Tardiphaga sp.]
MNHAIPAADVDGFTFHRDQRRGHHRALRGVPHRFRYYERDR